MKKFIVIILLFICSNLPAQTIDSTWFVTHYTKKEIYIPMRDGVKLFTSFYIPNDSAEKHPILLTRTPYSCAPYGENNYKKYWLSYFTQYIHEGYIFVTQDVRGRWMSEGDFANVRPFNANKEGKEIDEASDTYDAIDWMVKNIPGNNGNVGVMGISYPGFYSTEAALSGHPALKAVSPQAPVTDWFAGDDFHHNGVFFAMDAYEFYIGRGFGKPRPKPTTAGPEAKQFFTNNKYDYYLKTGALPNLTAVAKADSVWFWDTLMSHPTYDAFWKARNARAGCYNVKPAVMVVGGLFDAEDCFGAWQTFKAIEKQSPATNLRIVEGPWYHGQWASKKGFNLGNVQFGSNTAEWYEQHIEFPFFNYYLKGKGSVDSLAKATVFFTGENQWHKLVSWPPADVKMTDIYLGDNRQLSFTKPTVTKQNFSEYISDPAHPVPYAEGELDHRTREYMTDDQRFASRRTDVLSFETNTLTEDVTLAGPVIADLMVSLSTTDADFVVKLIDVFPDDFKYSDTDTYLMNGYQMLVRAEIMRGKFRNSLEKPEPFVPGKITQVKYELPDVAHTFKKGHKIMVQVQSSWFPLTDRNPQQFLDIYHAKDSDFIKSDIKVYHDAGNASKLVLPIVK
ncbi:CocE/NonD family hydrolase [Parafilimonas sp.]|uniref:CocE/NonD family hydrolase n=1 Tax=Parafilimonas sp. TaxID=1969739 RepID=UPI003F7F5934